MIPAPWPHQREYIAFAAPKEASMCAAGMGCGKSAASAHLIADEWQCRRVLIVTPPSVRSVWRRELPKHTGDYFRPIILDTGSVAERTRQAAAALRDSSPAAVAVNIEASWREPFASWALAQRWCAVVYDEAHGIKAEGAACSAFAAKLTARSEHRVCLTGTPLSHSPLDAWGQYRFLDPAIFGPDYTAFLARYAAPKQMRLRKKLRTSHEALAAAIAECFGPDSPLLDEWGDPPDVTKQIPGLRNAAEFAAKIAPITWQCASADVLDLPPLIQEHREVALTPEGRRVYDALQCELEATLADGNTVEITSRLSLLTRLQQITSGFLPTPDGRINRVDTAKRRALYDLLAETTEPTVVFCRYVADLDTVREVAASLKRRYGELSHRRKDAITDMATLAENVDVVGVQPKSGGVGIDLSRAKVGVWFSLAFSLMEFDQGTKRLHRPGTTGVRMYSLVVPDTIDAEIHSAIADRREIVDAVYARMKRRALCPSP